MWWQSDDARSRRLRAFGISTPLNTMLPALGRTMLRIIRASVVLPLPDSPMTARISGRVAPISKLTSSTAFARRPKSPPR